MNSLDSIVIGRNLLLLLTFIAFASNPAKNSLFALLSKIVRSLRRAGLGSTRSKKERAPDSFVEIDMSRFE